MNSPNLTARAPDGFHAACLHLLVVLVKDCVYPPALRWVPVTIVLARKVTSARGIFASVALIDFDPASAPFPTLTLQTHSHTGSARPLFRTRPQALRLTP